MPSIGSFFSAMDKTFLLLTERNIKRFRPAIDFM